MVAGREVFHMINNNKLMFLNPFVDLLFFNFENYRLIIHNIINFLKEIKYTHVQ